MTDYFKSSEFWQCVVFLIWGLFELGLLSWHVVSVGQWGMTLSLFFFPGGIFPMQGLLFGCSLAPTKSGRKQPTNSPCISVQHPHPGACAANRLGHVFPQVKRWAVGFGTESEFYELRESVTGSRQLVACPSPFSSDLRGLLACSYSAGPCWEKALCPASLLHVRKLGDSLGMVIVCFEV
jgi:hypothetical protein